MQRLTLILLALMLLAAPVSAGPDDPVIRQEREFTIDAGLLVRDALDVIRGTWINDYPDCGVTIEELVLSTGLDRLGRISIEQYTDGDQDTELTRCRTRGRLEDTLLGRLMAVDSREFRITGLIDPEECAYFGCLSDPGATLQAINWWWTTSGANLFVKGLPSGLSSLPGLYGFDAVGFAGMAHGELAVAGFSAPTSGEFKASVFLSRENEPGIEAEALELAAALSGNPGDWKAEFTRHGDFRFCPIRDDQWLGISKDWLIWTSELEALRDHLDNSPARRKRIKANMYVTFSNDWVARSEREQLLSGFELMGVDTDAYRQFLPEPDNSMGSLEYELRFKPGGYDVRFSQDRSIGAWDYRASVVKAGLVAHLAIQTIKDLNMLGMPSDSDQP